ncbi:MAG: hypothetical protein V3T59_03060 [Desulfobacterales bacterium]
MKYATPQYHLPELPQYHLPACSGISTESYPGEIPCWGLRSRISQGTAGQAGHSGIN